MFENDYDMALSNEDLFMLVLGGFAFLFSFSDILADTQAVLSFPTIILFLFGWGIVRFRKRPLPKQVQSTRFIYLSLIKIIRNYALFSLIIQNIFLLSGYIQSDSYARIVSLYNLVVLIIASILEIAGHVTVPDDLHVFHLLEGEDEETIKKNRFSLLYGLRFWIWISFTSLIVLGITVFPFSISFIAAFNDNQILVPIFQFVALLLGAGLFVYTYFNTMSFDKLEKPDMIIKAVDYYNTVDLRERSYEILDNYIENTHENLGLLSKLAIMNTQDENHHKVLDLTRRILNETEEKEINVPHMIARAHLLQAISLKAIENFKLAYEEVTKSLHYIPENDVARKLRRDLRRILKVKNQEKG
jgi:hypothetical protein